jgi:MYXO-CTERM domain-containing protein
VVVVALIRRKLRCLSAKLTAPAALAPRDGSAPQLKAWVGTDFGEHCFFVEALDTSGNSATGPMSCMNVGPKGPPGRIGENGLLIEEAGGCGCSAHGEAGSPLWLGVLALALLRRR